MDGSPAPRATRRQVARDHLVRAFREPEALVATALRTKSRHSLELLAEAAWPGHGPRDLDEWASKAPHLHPDMDIPWLGRFAHVLALLQLGDRERGRLILDAIADAGRIDELDPHTIELLAQLRLADGQWAATVDLLEHPAVREAQRVAIEADLSNPALFPGKATEAEWIHVLNGVLHSREIAPIGLRHDTAASAFDRLTAPGAAPVRSPYHVTVLMSCYRPGGPVFTAARSVLEQTWQNLELIIVDDASGPEYAAVLDALERLDPRVRVIRKAVNGGTYRARNTGLRLATGDFCTVVDSDDWLHPQGLEMHLRPLLADPALMGTISEGVRVTEDLVLNRPGYLPRVSSAASLTFRLPQVLSRVGFLDTTSKGADTEFIRRIEAAFGPQIQHIPEVLSILRAGESLSSAEFSRGWRHPARHAYKNAYRPWHERIARRIENPFLDPDEPRRFPEPRRWAKPSDDVLAPPRGIDLCLAGDWRRYGGPQRSMLEELRAAQEAGLTVAVMHLEAFRFMTRKDLPLCEPVMRLINEGLVEWVHPDDDVDIDVLLIRYPPILQYPPHLPSHARVKHLLVMANQAPLEPDGRDQRYVVSDVTERATELFGVAPTWVPQSPAIRRILVEQDPGVPLAEWDNPGLIDVGQWHVRPPRPVGRTGKVVIGRYSRDDPMKFPPTWDELKHAYGFGPKYEVRMMGAVHTVPQLADEAAVPRSEIPKNWIRTRHKSRDVTDFLAELDFFVYMDNPGAYESFGRTLLEAAASGVLTIAHPKHRVTFGDVFDYAEAGEVQQLVGHYVSHPEAYRERVERARRSVEARYGHRGFVNKIRPLLTSSPHRPDGPVATDARVELRRSGPTPPTEHHMSVSPPWAVRNVRLRSAADGEHADTLAVVYRQGSENAVKTWLAGRSFATADSALAAAMVESVPEQVAVVALMREGRVYLASRTPIHGVEVTSAPPEASGEGTPPWFVTEWSSRHGQKVHVG